MRNYTLRLQNLAFLKGLKTWVKKLEILDKPEGQEQLIHQQEIMPGLTVQDIGEKS